jgi:hypothetical protein
LSLHHEEKTMKDLLKVIARDVILPWALTAIAGFAAKKLAAAKAPEAR